MKLVQTNELLIEALRGYSVRQLQFAIRQRMLPTPDKLKNILKRKYGSENDIKLLIKSLSDMQGYR